MTKLILFIFLLSSCALLSPVEDTNPFIVHDVSTVFQTRDDLCKYTCDTIDYSILAPCGMFNIGDTIRLTK